MSEEEEPATPAEAPAASSVTSDDMAAALDAVKASSPELSQAIDAAGVTPESLAGAHDAATGADDESEQA